MILSWKKKSKHSSTKHSPTQLSSAVKLAFHRKKKHEIPTIPRPCDQIPSASVHRESEPSSEKNPLPPYSEIPLHWIFPASGFIVSAQRSFFFAAFLQTTMQLPGEKSLSFCHVLIGSNGPLGLLRTRKRHQTLSGSEATALFTYGESLALF